MHSPIAASSTNLFELLPSSSSEFTSFPFSAQLYYISRSLFQCLILFSQFLRLTHSHKLNRGCFFCIQRDRQSKDPSHVMMYDFVFCYFFIFPVNCTLWLCVEIILHLPFPLSSACPFHATLFYCLYIYRLLSK